MKDQYFGDVNDYRKYGLLRALAGDELTLGVCWMLTPADGRSDGAKLGYLKQPKSFRHRDPDLFDAIGKWMNGPEDRSVGLIERSSLLGDAIFCSALLGDTRPSRETFFSNAHQQMRDRDLVFFDPDNGLEVGSVRAGSRGSNKYLYWPEVERTTAQGSSVLVYQHFPRKERSAFSAALATRLARAPGVSRVTMFTTSHVLFLLGSQSRHDERLSRGTQRVRDRWADEIMTQELAAVRTDPGRQESPLFE